MTTTDRPVSLDDLLRAAVLTDDPLGAVVAGQVAELTGAVENLMNATRLEAARHRSDLRPDQEAMMGRARDLAHRLKTFFCDGATGTARDEDPSRTQVLVSTPTPEGRDRTSPPPRAGGLERRRIDVGVERVLRDFADDPEVFAALGPETLPGRTSTQQWLAFHLGLLRLPRGQADQWRKRIGRDLPQDWNVFTNGWYDLRADVDPPQVLIPAYHDTPGVLARSEAMPEELVLGALNDRVLTHPRIVAIASQMLWLARTDKSAWYAGKTELVPAQSAVSDLQATMRDRLIAYRTAETSGDGATMVVRAAQLAEVLRSVVHRPLPAPDSWWGAARTAAMTFVDEVAAKNTPHLRVKDLGKRPVLYKELLSNGEVDAENDIRLKPSKEAEVGRIFDCLRPSLMDSTVVYRTGRVIYTGALEGIQRERR